MSNTHTQGELKRYEPYLDRNPGSENEYADMRESKRGEYVLYSDIEPALNLINRLNEMGVSADEAEQIVKERMKLFKANQAVKDSMQELLTSRRK